MVSILEWNTRRRMQGIYAEEQLSNFIDLHKQEQLHESYYVECNI